MWFACPFIRKLTLFSLSLNSHGNRTRILSRINIQVTPRTAGLLLVLRVQSRYMQFEAQIHILTTLFLSSIALCVGLCAACANLFFNNGGFLIINYTIRYIYIRYTYTGKFYIHTCIYIRNNTWCCFESTGRSRWWECVSVRDSDNLSKSQLRGSRRIFIS
jgi:hypothetical protein